MHVLSDLEKGKDNPDNPEKPRGFTRLINVTEGSSDNLPPARLKRLTTKQNITLY
jgi:hypothetical protein